MKSFKSTMTGLLAAREGEVSRQEAIARAIIEKAMAGDLHAAAFIRDLTDKKKSPQADKSIRTVTVRVLEQEK
ncbi:MAG: hypothetical protein IKY33_03195 [Clostridia bacterium]|nr:hypothetical protein [Clostridia bacterium]